MPPPNHPEAGFAMYIAFGFIALITVLVSQVGDRLNVAVLAEARETETQKLLRQADIAMQRGLIELKAILPGSLPADATDVNAAADRSACLDGRLTSTTGFVASNRTTSGTLHTRYYLRVDGTDYTALGCALENGDARQTMARWTFTTPSTFTLVRLRQF